jgi:hypothetical protein
VTHLSYLVGACLSAALLAGCGGSSNRFYPATPMSGAPQPHLGHYFANAGDSRAHDTSLKGEVLTAGDVTVKYLGDHRGDATTKFHASGMAKGPYPGTFIASGEWHMFFLNHRWAFSESFTITSRGHSISGTIAGYGDCCNVPITKTTFGPATLQYTSGPRSGPVTTNKIMAGSLSESFH